jgi:hypothetical protein
MMKTYSLVTPSCKILGGGEKVFSDHLLLQHHDQHKQHQDHHQRADIMIDPPAGLLAGQAVMADRVKYYPLSCTDEDQYRNKKICWLSPCMIEHSPPRHYKNLLKSSFDSCSFTSKSNTEVTTNKTNKKNTVNNDTENDSATSSTSHELLPFVMMNTCTQSKSPSTLYCHQVVASSNTLNSESLLQTYIEHHETLASHDHQDAVEICRGAAALCMMKRDLQLGVGSNAYNQRHGITAVHHDYDSSDMESSSDCSDSNDIYFVQHKHKRQEGTDTETNKGITSSISNPFGEGHRTQKRQKTSSTTRQQMSTTTNNQSSMSSSLLPSSLALASDHQHVNKLHAFVRSELLELFQVPFHQHGDHDEEEQDEYDHDVACDSTDPSSSTTNAKNTVPSLPSSRRITRNTLCKSNRESLKPNKIPHTSSPRHFPGRVGLRCVYCANVPKKNQQAMPYFYPKGLSDLYRSTCTWQRVHFKNCSYIPSSVKRKYYNLKESDKVSFMTVTKYLLFCMSSFLFN